MKKFSRFLALILALQIGISLVSYPHTTEAYLDASTWYDMPPTTLTECVLDYRMYWHDFGEGGEWRTEVYCTAATQPRTYTKMSPFSNELEVSAGVRAFVHKPVTCPASSPVLTGVSFYSEPTLVTQEHIDGLCTELSGSSNVGSGSWYSPTNRLAILRGSYKTIVCPAGRIATGVRMYGTNADVGDEHVDVQCSDISGFTISTAAAAWVSAPNAGSNSRVFKTAVCPANTAMIGLRWYEFRDEIDDEHVDAYCAPLVFPAPGVPTVSGPNSIAIGSPATFTFSGTHPNNNQIRYGIDWTNDGVQDELVPSSGYVNSGTTRTSARTWATAGTYSVRVRTQDDHGTYSAWSPAESIIVTNNPVIELNFR